MGSGLIKSERSSGRIRKIMGRIDVASGTPSVGAGNGFTIADTAAGKVTVTLSRPGRTIVGVSATALQATDTAEHHVKVLSKTEASAVVFGVFVGDGTDGVLADDVSFYFEISVKDGN